MVMSITTAPLFGFWDSMSARCSFDLVWMPNVKVEGVWLLSDNAEVQREPDLSAIRCNDLSCPLAASSCSILSDRNTLTRD